MKEIIVTSGIGSGNLTNKYYVWYQNIENGRIIKDFLIAEYRTASRANKRCVKEAKKRKIFAREWDEDGGTDAIFAKD